MSLFTLPYNPAIGPIVNVGIFFPAPMVPAGDPVDPRAFAVAAMLVDTGADMTSISTALATQLNLPVLGQTPLRSVTHQLAVNVYLADFTLSVQGIPPVQIPNIRLLEFPQGNDTVQGLMGRDLLGASLVQVNGKDNTLTIAF